MQQVFQLEQLPSAPSAAAAAGAGQNDADNAKSKTAKHKDEIRTPSGSWIPKDWKPCPNKKKKMDDEGKSSWDPFDKEWPAIACRAGELTRSPQ